MGRAWRLILAKTRQRELPAGALTVVLAGIVGVLAGLGAVGFTLLINFVTRWSVSPIISLAAENRGWLLLLCAVPAAGLVAVSWLTRRFAPEAQGHGVPEVIVSVARHGGVIRPRVSLVKILASGLCIGTGGSIGREGPIVQIGSSLGSMAGQFFGLSPRHMKVLVAAGAAAGISATFNAPLAGVIFASEIILCSFAVESLTPIVIASVLADVVQLHLGEHGFDPAFPHLHHRFSGAWEQLPSYVLLGLVCGIAAVCFTKLLYFTEDFANTRLPKWWLRALVFGGLVGVAGMAYPMVPPVLSPAAERTSQAEETPSPPLFGVGYGVIAHTLHLEYGPKTSGGVPDTNLQDEQESVTLNEQNSLTELWWLLPLIFLKPLLTSLTLSGGGSGGIFAPSLFLGATLGASFGIISNHFVPGWSANPGVYAIVGMGAVVAGTTHGMLSAMLIVYEMTDDYRIILPIMITAGLASIVARFIDPDSIYLKKLSRRGESITRGHDLHRMEHIMVRDVMIREFPRLKTTDTVTEIVKIALANPHIESLPVMGTDGQLVGIMRSEDLHWVLDSDISPSLLNADDIALAPPLSVSPDENLLEALRDFGARDIESLPVVVETDGSERLVGLLLRADVMRRYREEMLKTDHRHRRLLAIAGDP